MTNERLPRRRVMKVEKSGGQKTIIMSCGHMDDVIWNLPVGKTWGCAQCAGIRRS